MAAVGQTRFTKLKSDPVAAFDYPATVSSYSRIHQGRERLLWDSIADPQKPSPERKSADGAEAVRVSLTTYTTSFPV